jgi:hypothetical protein
MLRPGGLLQRRSCPGKRGIAVLPHVCELKLQRRISLCVYTLGNNPLAPYSSMIRYGFPVLCSAGADTL